MKKLFIVLFMVAFLVFGAVNVAADESSNAVSDVSSVVYEESVTQSEAESKVESEADTKTESNTETESKAETEGAVEELNIDFQPSRFVDNLGKMGIGMIGIFIVMGVVIIVTSILNNVTATKK